MKKRQQGRKQKQHKASYQLEQPQSAFLHCLEQLDEDAWTQTLLAKLHTSGSAANVALTCCRLRALVHGNLTSLKFGLHLTGLNPVQIEQWTAPLPARFPKCLTVKMSLGPDSSYVSAASLLPALSRLPSLQMLLLDILNPFCPAGVGMLLGSIRSQLTSVNNISVLSALGGVSTAAWQQLAGMTRLTGLRLGFDSSLVSNAYCNKALRMCDLAALQGLLHLQHLTLSAPDVCSVQQHSGLQFLDHLTALTELHLAIPETRNFSSVSRCTNLRSLVVQVPKEGLRHTFCAADCAAVSHLTRLTNMTLGWPLQQGAAPVLYTALQSLQQLQCMSAPVWTPQVLPVVAGLTQLTAIHGAWQTDDQCAAQEQQQQQRQRQTRSSTAAGAAVAVSSSSDVSCPYVQQLGSAAGAVPFKAFPDLKLCSHNGSLEPSALADIVHCTKMQSLLADPPACQQPMCLKQQCSQRWTSLPAGAPVAARVDALHSLAKLPFALLSVTWHAQDDAELAALAVGANHVICVTVVVPKGSSVTPSGLMQLGRLGYLQDMTMSLLGLSLSMAEARMLLSGLCRARLRLNLCSHHDVRIFQEAGRWASEAGLCIPITQIFGPNPPPPDGFGGRYDDGAPAAIEQHAY